MKFHCVVEQHGDGALCPTAGSSIITMRNFNFSFITGFVENKMWFAVHWKQLKDNSILNKQNEETDLAGAKIQEMSPWYGASCAVL